MYSAGGKKYSAKNEKRSIPIMYIHIEKQKRTGEWDLYTAELGIAYVIVTHCSWQCTISTEFGERVGELRYS